MKRRIFLILVVVILFVGAKSANAGTTYLWAGGASGNWTTNANWSPSTGYPGSGGSTTDIATINISNATITLTASLTINSFQTLVNTAGTAGVTGNTLSVSSGITLTITGGFSMHQPASASTCLTFSGSGATTIGGTSTPSYLAAFTISSGATVSFSSGSTLDISSSQQPFTNNGTLKMIGTSASPCTFTIGYQNSLTNASTGTCHFDYTTINLNGSGAGCSIFNSGTITAYECTIKIAGSKTSYITNQTSSSSFTSNRCAYTFTGSGSGCYISNSGTFNDYASTFSITASGAYILNNASSTMLFRGSVITGSTGSGNAIQNAGTLTADSSAAINLTTYQTELYNTGTFYAGLSNSPCIITLTAQGTNITNAGSGTFVLGSTSEIAIGTSSISPYQAYVSNSGTFTLMSDRYGSASIGQNYGTGYSSGLAPLQGTFNVQRYITGNQTTLAYRGYRLLSSPVNLTSGYQGTSGSPNYIAFNTLKNPYTVGATTYNGAFTGGSGSGFFFTNSNPTIYLYDETLSPTATSLNSSFTSGKNVGLSGISTSTVNTTSTFSGATVSNLSVPEGNGFLLFYVGSTNGRASGSKALVPDSTTRITYVGDINSLVVPVVLWYTPGGGSAGNMSFTSTLSTSSPGWKGFNMVGNPYPCTIDLKKVYSDNTSFTIFYELVDVTGSYVSYGYNGSTVTTSSPTYSSQYIASGQGFFVVAPAAGKSLTFQEDEKVYLPGTLTSPTLASPSSPPGILAKRVQGTSLDKLTDADQPSTKAIINTAELAGLHMMLQQDSITFHECGIYFNNKSSDNFDNNDAIDIDGTSPVLYMSSFTSDGISTAINSMADYVKGKRVKLYVKSTTSGLFSLNLEDIAGIDTSAFNIYLVDNKQRDSLDIVRYKTYNFNISTSDTTTFGADRFVLAIERKPLPPYELVSFTGQKANNGVSLTWKTYNEGDYTGFALQKLDGSSNQYNTLYSLQSNGKGTYTYTDPNPVTGNNTYRLMQNNIDSVITYTTPLNVLYNISTSSGVLSVYPNPAHEAITVSFNNVNNANATYQASIYNSLGALMMQANVSGNSWTQDVSSLKPGAYILKVTGSNGASIGNSKFIKYQ